MKSVFTNCLKTLVFLLFVAALLNPLFANTYKFKSGGKSYEIVMDRMGWEEAAMYAVSKGGYLVHIESQSEQTAVYNAIISGANIRPDYISIMDGGGVAYVWIGSTDKKEEGVWLWDGNNDGEGDNFWNGQGLGGAGTGKPVGNSYWNWGGKSTGAAMEPDDFNKNQDAAAIALEPWPKNIGIMGKAGEWNDISILNRLYFVIEYDFVDVPGKCDIPQGETNICTSVKTSEYSVNQVANATEYVWTLAPSSAGIIIGAGKTITVEWNEKFFGQAELQVIARNPIGDGEKSPVLNIAINSAPEATNAPIGEKIVCNFDKGVEYSVVAVDNADTYDWRIIPENAGTIEELGIRAKIDWSDEFTGVAIVSVASVNDCGKSDYTSLEITVNANPEKANLPHGDTELKKNPPNTQYVTAPIKGVSEYLWRIVPEFAGEITGHNNTAVVDWNDEFVGTAQISTAGINNCGEGEYSESLVVKIEDAVGSVYSNIAFINIYPNPVNDLLNIEIQGVGQTTLIITDQLGRTLYNSIIDAVEQNRQIPLAQFTAGIYNMLIIYANGKTEYLKFVKL